MSEMREALRRMKAAGVIQDDPDTAQTDPPGFTHLSQGDLACDQCGARVINTLEWVQIHLTWHRDQAIANLF